MIKLERCRQHEVHSIPRAWEHYQDFASDSELIAWCDSYPPRLRNASGDIYRVIIGTETFGLQEYLMTCV